MRSWLLFSGFCLVTTAVLAEDAPPRSLDPRLKVTLFAEHPQIVTPTGIDVDHKGRVWAIESNTHFPPEGYTGHPTDRVLVMSDTDGDGRADRIVVFKDGIKHAMSVALRPLWFPAQASGGRQSPDAVPAGKAASAEKTPAGKPASDNASEKVDPKSDAGVQAELQGADAPRSPASSAYIATRKDIVLYHDDDGDDKADREELIVRLDSPGDYPHDGLAGFAFDALGWLHFGFGENLGAPYKVIGSDGTTLSGGAEGGSVYRCRLDGTKLERLATGFWNPHASCFDAFGRMFTVDNDPDSRPPCRLLHIIPGGDYGYRFRYGRKGLHPFSCWNGEIAGTLPMVAGTGEAPSGILAYESDGLPEEYIGNLFVTSWGDHRIDRFRLKERGASFESLAEPVIVGGVNFRPVGIACAPDGTLYFTDWILQDYNLHLKGRVWRIEAIDRSAGKPERESRVFQIEDLASKSLVRRRTAAIKMKQELNALQELNDYYRNPENDERARTEAALAYSSEVRDIRAFLNFKENDSGEPAKQLARPADVAYYLAVIDQHKLDSDPNFTILKKFLGVSAVSSFGNEKVRKEVPISWQQMLASVFDFTNLWNESEPKRSQFLGQLNGTLAEADPFLFSTFVTSIGERSTSKDLLSALDDKAFESPTARVALMLAARRRGPKDQAFVKRGLSDESVLVRRLSVQWIAEEKLTDFRPQVEAILNDPKITADLFLATLAALEMLEGVPPAQFDMTPPGKYVLPLVKDEKRPAAVRALALRLVDPAEPALDDKLLASLLNSGEAALKLEVVRTLQQSPAARGSVPLRAVAADNEADSNLRAEALVGLGRPTGDGKASPETRAVLVKLMNWSDRALQREALRSLRGFVAKDGDVQKAIEAFAKGSAGGGDLKSEVAFALNPSGGSRPPLADVREKVLEPKRDSDDPLAGRRGFYHVNGAGCFRCHTVDGRGGKIGPDLSTIGRALSREKLLDSILEPSKEVAPQFVSWAMETADGRVHTGMLVHENEGKTVLGDAEGKLTELPTIAIVQRTAQKTSVMPEKLADRMTVQEFRDLLAFLEGLK